ncbi:hypothetical protein PHLGIDRAFT_95971, partial [Phlebiopsis gigantea 11061_1 CR5-6]
MLPLALLCLLQAQLALSQSSVSLALNSLYTPTPTARTTPSLFALPTSSANVSVSVALCASAATPPRFFVSNDSSVRPSQSDVGEPGVYEITLSQGYGEWRGPFSDGGYLAVSGAGQVPFEVGVSDGGAMHAAADELPLLGDTTNNQVLLFSPVLANATLSDSPTYPNYTLPPANLAQPSSDPGLLNGLSLFVAPTTALNGSSLPLTGCAMRNGQKPVGMTIGTSNATGNGLWLKDEDGWRFQWLVNGLSAQTNYTAYVIQDGTKLSGPINFVTKSVSFSCPIVHSLPYCPSTAYSVPVAMPRPPALAHTAGTLGEAVAAPLLDTLANFTISLTTFPCGRDAYSPLVSCADCQAAYRKWLCAVWFPRCSEASPSSSSSSSSASASATSFFGDASSP